jgi:hypothetical protein
LEDLFKKVDDKITEVEEMKKYENDEDVKKVLEELKSLKLALQRDIVEKYKNE